MTNRTLSLATSLPSSQDEEEKAVQDMVDQVLLLLEDANDKDHENSLVDPGYDTDDSWEVTRRRLAHKREMTGVFQCSRRPAVDRNAALRNLPTVPWLDDKSGDGGDGDDEVARYNKSLAVQLYMSNLRKLSISYGITSRRKRIGAPADSSIPSTVVVGVRSPQPRQQVSSSNNSMKQSPMCRLQTSPDSVAQFSLNVNSDRMTAMNGMFAQHMARATASVATTSPVATKRLQQDTKNGIPSPGTVKLQRMTERQRRLREMVHRTELEIQMLWQDDDDDKRLSSEESSLTGGGALEDAYDDE